MKKALYSLGLLLIGLLVGAVGVFVSNNKESKSRAQKVHRQLEDTKIKMHKKRAELSSKEAKLHLSKAKQITRKHNKPAKSKSVPQALSNWNKED